MSAYGLAAMGEIANVGNTAMSNVVSEQFADRARRKNWSYGELSAHLADQRTRRLYADLESPAALLQQYRDAGLSPSMMFGGGAIGGQPAAGAQGNGGAGIQPQTYGIPPLDLAQLELINAQTRKTNAEAATEEGTNERGRAEINKIVAESNNVGLKNAWQEYENSIKMLEVQFKASTFDESIKYYLNECEYLKHKVTSARVQADIDEKSEQDVLKYLHEKTLNVIADTLLKKNQSTLTKANVSLNLTQMADLISQIGTRRQELEVHKGELKVHEDQLKAQVEQWCIENGFTEKKQQIAISYIVLDTYNKGLSRGLDFLQTLVPFTKGAPKNTGLQ